MSSALHQPDTGPSLKLLLAAEEYLLESSLDQVRHYYAAVESFSEFLGRQATLADVTYKNQLQWLRWLSQTEALTHVRSLRNAMGRGWERLQRAGRVAVDRLDRDTVEDLGAVRAAIPEHAKCS